MLEMRPKAVIAAVHGHCDTGALEVALAADFDARIEALASAIVANSGFSYVADKRLLEATDGGPLEAGLQWEVTDYEGVGPDMRELIAAFTGKVG